MISAIIIGSVCIGLILLGIGIYFYKSYLYNSSTTHKILAGVTYVFGAVVILLGGIVIPNKIANNNAIEKRAAIESKIDNGYDIYVNGTKVEPEHITIDSYSLDIITVHDDVNEIHIAANK